MKEIGKGIVITILVTTAIVLLSFGSVALYRAVAPKQAEAEREVFVNTPSYILGKEQALSGYRRQYRTAKDSILKRAIADAALDEAATVDQSKLSADARSFIAELKESK